MEENAPGRDFPRSAKSGMLSGPHRGLDRREGGLDELFLP